LAQDSGERVFRAMQPESTRPKRSLLAKTLCLAALLGAVYSLTTGMPTMVTGAFSAVSFMRPVPAGRAVGVQMGGGALGWGRYEQNPDRAANLAKAEEQRAAFKARNPSNYDLPQWLPFGEKMVGGRDEGKNYGPNRKDGQVKDWSGNGWTFWTF